MMTDAEFEEAMREMREYVRRTSFPAAPAEDQYEAHSHHVEYGEAAH